MCPETVMLPQKRPVAQGGRARGVSPGVTVNQISDGIQASVLRVEWGPRPRLLQARPGRQKQVQRGRTWPGTADTFQPALGDSVPSETQSLVRETKSRNGEQDPSSWPTVSFLPTNLLPTPRSGHFECPKRVKHSSPLPHPLARHPSCHFPWLDSLSSHLLLAWTPV